MNFYPIKPASKKTPKEILEAIGQAVLSLYPGLEIKTDLCASDSNQSHFSTLFFRKHSGRFIGVYISMEPLTHAALDGFEHQISETFKMRHEKDPAYDLDEVFVCFPSLGKGVAESLARMSSKSVFFKYYFLTNSFEESLALKKYTVEQIDKIPHENISKHFYRRIILSREELLELMELSLDLKKIPVF